MTNYDIKIPFCGFYESPANAMIDDYCNSLFDPDGQGEEAPSEFWEDFHYTTPMLESFCKEYVSRLETWLADSFDLDIKLSFEELDCPKFYNYRTDEIAGTITGKAVTAMYDQVDKTVLQSVMKARHQSRSGFASFYQHTLEDDGSSLRAWPDDVLLWDQIQLETLLLTFIATQNGAADIDFYEIMADVSGSGALDTIVFNSMPQSCQDLANKAFAECEKERASQS